MAPTIHQRVHGYLWHWKDGPGWCRDGAEIYKLRQAGMRVLKVHLSDDGPIPREQVVEWNAAGMKVWGMTWLTANSSPQALKDERNRLSLTGLDLNGEDPVLALDQQTGGLWSVGFATKLRHLCPTLPLHFDSYWGPMGGGINLGAWRMAGCRFSVQTFWGGEGIWDDPTTNIVHKGLGAQPILPKSILKPCIRVAKNNSGQLPDWDVVFTNTKVAGTKGVGLYYIDAMPLDEVCELTRRAIRSGVAY